MFKNKVFSLVIVVFSLCLIFGISGFFILENISLQNSVGVNENSKLIVRRVTNDVNGFVITNKFFIAEKYKIVISFKDENKNYIETANLQLEPHQQALVTFSHNKKIEMFRIELAKKNHKQKQVFKYTSIFLKEIEKINGTYEYMYHF